MSQNFPQFKPQDPRNLYDYDRDEGAKGMLAPLCRGWNFAALTLVANRAYYVRFVPSRAMLVDAIQFGVSTLAGSDDAVDVGLFNSLLNPLATAGATTGKLITAIGQKTVTFSGAATVQLLPRTTYYAAITCGAIGTTAGIIVGSAWGTTVASRMRGNPVAGTVEADFMNTAHPLPTGATTATGVNALNSATVNVGSTTGFPAVGAFTMGGVTTTYTGVTGTSFTGCGNHAATVGAEAIVPALTIGGGSATGAVLHIREAA